MNSTMPTPGRQAQNAAKTIGFIGLGMMGSALTTNLMAAGFRVRGFDVNPDRMNEFGARGGVVAASPADAADGADIVMTSLMSSDLVRKVVLGENGAAQTMRPDSILVDLSTVHPSATAALATELCARGLWMLDAAVSGSSTQAWERNVVLLVGGDDDVLARCRTALAAIGRSIHHMGTNGAGSRTKLAVNMALGLHRLVLAETLTFGLRTGIDGKRLLEVLRDCPSYSCAMDMTGDRMLEGRFDPESTLSQHRKDVELMLEVAHAAGLPLFLSNYHREVMIAGEAGGYGQSDTASLIAILHRFAGIDFKGTS